MYDTRNKKIKHKNIVSTFTGDDVYLFYHTTTRKALGVLPRLT